MGDTVIGIAEAKNELSQIINRAAYGGERIVIGSRGKPKAAIISIADLRKLELLDRTSLVSKQDKLAWLQRADALRQRIAEDRHGIPLPDSSEEIRRMREERSTR